MLCCGFSSCSVAAFAVLGDSADAVDGVLHLDIDSVSILDLR